MKSASVYATILPTGDRLYRGITIRCGIYPSRCWYVDEREYRTLGAAKRAVDAGPVLSPPRKRPAQRVTESNAKRSTK